MSADQLAAPPAAAEIVFGAALPRAVRYAELLATTGVAYGLVGPREVPRLWERHILNCAVVREAIGPDCRVLDVGSGAGLPGIPLALARPDLAVTLVEPMARRIAWLQDVAQELELDVAVVRGRAEEQNLRRSHGGAEVVTARAVAPLGRLVVWTMPLLRTGGWLLALKGASAAAEIGEERRAVLAAGGGEPAIVECGSGLLAVPTTVVRVERVESHRRGRGR